MPFFPLLFALPQLQTIDEIATAETWVKKLEEPGANYSVEPKFANVMVWIKAKEKPKAELRDQLAKTLHCEWIQAKGSNLVRLGRSPELRKQLSDTEASFWTHDVELWLKALPTETGTVEEVAAQYDRKLSAIVEGKSRTPMVGPIDELLVELTRAVGADALSRVELGAVVCYSNQPTASEKPFASGGDAQVSRFNAIQSALRQKLESKASRWDVYQRGRLIGEKPTKVGRVRLTVSSTLRTIFVYLVAYDEKGGIATWASQQIRSSRSKMFGKQIPERPLPEVLWQPRAAAKEKEVAQSWLASEDPLRSRALPGLRAAVEAPVNVMSVLPDALVTELELQPPKTTGYVLGACMRTGIEWAGSDDWYLGRYERPLYTGLISLPRTELRAYGASVGKDMESFRAFCVLAGKAEQGILVSPLDNWFGEKTGPLAVGGAPPWINIPLWLTIPLGRLPDSEWQRLLSHQKVALAPTSETRSILYDWSSTSATLLSAKEGETDERPRTGSFAYPHGLGASPIVSADQFGELHMREAGTKEWIAREDYAQRLVDSSTVKDPNRLVDSIVGKFEVGARPCIRFRVTFPDGRYADAVQRFAQVTAWYSPMVMKAFPSHVRDGLMGDVQRALASEGAARAIPPP